MCFRGIDAAKLLTVVIFCIAGGNVVYAMLDNTMTARVGDRIALPCRVPYNTEDNMVQWFMADNQLSIGLTMIHYNQRIEVNKPAPNEYSLIIKSVVKADEETFVCKSYKATYSRIKLEVQWRPVFDEGNSSPYRVTMKEGSTGQLKCMAEGRPKPVVTWYRRSQHAGSKFTEIGVTGHTLTLYDVTRYLNDVFMCNASNRQGQVNREMNVSVHFPPEVQIFEEDLHLMTNEQIMVTCLIQGSPLVDFYWKFKDIRIETNWKYLVITEHEEGYPLRFMTLMTRPGTLGPYDVGTYVCHADGDSREMEAEIRIHYRSKGKKQWPQDR